jgi:hypothetical protein
MQPESSDGFDSVGTILPEERAAPLPGGSFRLRRYPDGIWGLLSSIWLSPGPFQAALLAAPRILRIQTLENGVFRSTHRTLRQGEIGRRHCRFADDFLRNGLRGNGTRLVELIGGDEDAKIAYPD